MTQEEKAKAYDEALERARKLYESYNRLVLSTDEIERIFPELAESEDERIRRGMIDEIKAILRGEDLGFPPQDVLESRLAYLEKQKEQKSTECIEFANEFENQVSHLLASVLNGEYEYNKNFIKYAAQSLLGYAKNELKSTEWCKEEEQKNRY